MFRQLASAFVLLMLLIALLGFYYLKYVPDRRNELNRTAFMELNQLKNAVQYRNQAYQDAVTNSIQTVLIPPANTNPDTPYHVKPAQFTSIDNTRIWKISYDIANNKNAIVDKKSIDVDTLMTGLVSTHKDIFDDYLLIRNQSSVIGQDSIELKTRASPESGNKQYGQVIYQSPGLSVEYTIDLDTLLKIEDGFSLKNLREVTIDGNSYQLFVYPFIIGGQQLLLAGLIDRARYRETYEKIPFSFFTVFLILFLLLIIHLPILKIYVLGSNERIRDSDIRLIIGSYFIAAFFGFFLMSRIFLDRVQSIQNKTNLESLTKQVGTSFYNELAAIDSQLRFFDSQLLKMQNSGDPSLKKLTTEKDTTDKYTGHLDSLLKPYSYPYLTFVFWIDSSGQWVARWSYKNTFGNAPLLKVKDRQYFRDFLKNKALKIEGVDDSINIQPTLSKLEGEYIVTVVKRSRARPDSLKPKPFLIGLSSEMYSIDQVLLPPGYGFSIIDEQGDIQFDSKVGRPLLSNIFKELEDPGTIQQTANYRTTRYFDHIRLRGKTMALLSTPLKGTRYQLLVYFNLSRIDSFNEHLVGLSVVLMGCVIALLILASLVNQWSKTKFRILESRSQHFEWLHPSSRPLKQKYYAHQIVWMVLLFAVYMFFWILVESFFRRFEFALFYISLLFPFYTAIHYFELRERFYDVQESRTGLLWYFSRPSLALRGLLLLIILVIISFSTAGGFFKQWPVIVTQLAWIAMIIWSTYRFKRNMIIYEKPGNTAASLSNQHSSYVPGKDKHRDMEPVYHDKLLNPYIFSILIGVMMISIIPACAIFWLLFRQASSMRYNSDQLTIARLIDVRRSEINDRLDAYKLGHDVNGRQSIADLKFKHGIYLNRRRVIDNDFDTRPTTLNFPGREYIQMHQQFFGEDTAVLAWANPPDTARDGTWYFGIDTCAGNKNSQLIFRNRTDQVNTNSFRLAAKLNDNGDKRAGIMRTLIRDNKIFFLLFLISFFFALALAYFVTRSLTGRIFLLNLKKNDRPEKINEATQLYDKLVNRQELKKIIYDVYQQTQICPIEPYHKGNPFQNPRYPEINNIYFFERNLPMSILEENILRNMKILEKYYQTLWNELDERQKFLLFDFAQDGFSNYKSEKDLRQLMNKGLLFFDDLRLTTMTLSFQEYVLLRKGDKQISNFVQTAAKEDTWKKLKTPLLILLTCVGIFIFFTQDAVYQKITGLLTSLTSLLPLLTRLFNTKENGKT